MNDEDSNFVEFMLLTIAIAFCLGVVTYMLTLPSNVQELAAQACEDRGGVNLIQHDKSGFTCNNGEVHYVMEIEQ